MEVPGFSHSQEVCLEDQTQEKKLFVTSVLSVGRSDPDMISAYEAPLTYSSFENYDGSFEVIYFLLSFYFK